MTSNLLRKTKKALRKKPSDVSNDYKKKKKRDLLDTANSTIELLNVLGITVSDLGVVDEFGNRINLKDGKKVKVGKRKEVKTKVKEISVDKALYLKDSLCISDRTYRSLATNLKELPRLKEVKKRTKEINDLFPVYEYGDDIIGAWEPIATKLNSVLDNMISAYPEEPTPKKYWYQIKWRWYVHWKDNSCCQYYHESNIRKLP